VTALLEVLSCVLLAIHLLAVNFAMAVPLVCIWLEWRESTREDELAASLGRSLAQASIASLLFGVTLGGLLLWWIWRQDLSAFYRTVGKLPTERWGFLIAEILFYVGCMAAYVGLWNRLRTRRLWHRLLAIVAATNLLYHFPPLFVMLSVVSSRPDLADLPYDHQAYLRLWADAEVLSRVMHHWLASAAVAGTATALFAWRMSRRDSTNDVRRLVAGGAKIALIASGLQVPVGIWVLAELPAMSRNALTGGDQIATTLFAASVFTALALLNSLANLSCGDVRRGHVAGALASLTLTVILMVSALERVTSYAII
jgi:hypothetical protein